jgi:L-aminopeptidase/D-esterase-like protein
VITDVTGVRVGHWTHPSRATGCTVALFPARTVASGEVRGGAPATREWALLAPERIVARIDAVVLAGGSAFGLAAADGVMRFCEERGMGFATPAGPVPIVVAAGLYDLMTGDGRDRPDADAGYAACEAATTGPFDIGGVGAGAGATVNKWRGREFLRGGGVGSAAVRHGDLVVGALMAVNAFGSVLSDGERLPELTVGPPADPFTNTTIGVVATNAALDKVACLSVAQAAQDGLARVLFPAHAGADGDAIVAAALGPIAATVEQVRVLAVAAVERAVRAAVLAG